MPKHPAPAATFVPDEATRLIFRRAIRNKPDSRVVRVRPQDLVAAFGQQQAEDLAGDPIDLDSLQGKARATRQRELDGLKAERAELQQLVQAGHKDSRRELQELNTLINKLRAGQLRTQALVVVPVGELREALGMPAYVAPEPSTSDDGKQPTPDQDKPKDK